MDFLLHNPLAEMYGPLFLLFYASVIVVTLATCRFLVHQSVSGTVRVPRVPVNPDPYQIAYLRLSQAGSPVCSAESRSLSFRAGVWIRPFTGLLTKDGCHVSYRGYN